MIGDRPVLSAAGFSADEWGLRVPGFATPELATASVAFHGGDCTPTKSQTHTASTHRRWMGS